MVVALDRLEDLRGAREHRPDEHAAVEAQVLERGDVERIGHRDHQRRAALDLDRKRAVLLRQLLLDHRQRLLVGGGLVQVDEREAELALELLQQLHPR